MYTLQDGRSVVASLGDSNPPAIDGQHLRDPVTPVTSETLPLPRGGGQERPGVYFPQDGRSEVSSQTLSHPFAMAKGKPRVLPADVRLCEALRDSNLKPYACHECKIIDLPREADYKTYRQSHPNSDDKKCPDPKTSIDKESATLLYNQDSGRYFHAKDFAKAINDIMYHPNVIACIPCGRVYVYKDKDLQDAQEFHAHTGMCDKKPRFVRMWLMDELWKERAKNRNELACPHCTKKIKMEDDKDKRVAAIMYHYGGACTWPSLFIQPAGTYSQEQVARPMQLRSALYHMIHQVTPKYPRDYVMGAEISKVKCAKSKYRDLSNTLDPFPHTTDWTPWDLDIISYNLSKYPNIDIYNLTETLRDAPPSPEEPNATTYRGLYPSTGSHENAAAYPDALLEEEYISVDRSEPIPTTRASQHISQSITQYSPDVIEDSQRQPTRPSPRPRTTPLSHRYHQAFAPKPPIEVRNRFSSLAPDEPPMGQKRGRHDDSAEMEVDPEAEQPTKKQNRAQAGGSINTTAQAQRQHQNLSKKDKTTNSQKEGTSVPPIIIDAPLNKETAGYLKEWITRAGGSNDKSYLIAKRNITIVKMESRATREKMVEIIGSEMVPYFSYRNNNDIPKRFILKNVPTYLTCEEISKELCDQKKIKIVTVKRLKSRRQDNKGVDLPLVQVVVLRDETLDSLRQKCPRMLGLAVTWDKFRASGLPPICNRCQRIGHHEAYCGLIPNCCICGEAHQSEECYGKIRNNETVERKCYRCQGDHQANWKGCPKLQQYLHDRERKREEEVAKRLANKPRTFAPAPKENPWSGNGNFPRLPSRNNNSRNNEAIPHRAKQGSSTLAQQVKALTGIIQRQVPDKQVPPEIFLQAFNELLQELNSGSLHSMMNAAAIFIETIS